MTTAPATTSHIYRYTRERLRADDDQQFVDVRRGFMPSVRIHYRLQRMMGVPAWLARDVIVSMLAIGAKAVER